MRDMLPAIFSILTGLSFLTILVVGLLARPALKPLWGRLIALSMVCSAGGFFLLSRATTTSIGSGAELFAGAGAAFFVGSLLVMIGLFLRSREAR